jgi:Phage Terminase
MHTGSDVLSAAFLTPHSGLPDESERIAGTAAGIGLTLMPWQRDALAVATQHEDGRYLHPVVVVSVPRQSGKSIVLKALALDRLVNGGIGGGPWEGALVAQARQDAARFLIDWSEHEQLQLRAYRGIGNERLHHGPNQIRPYAPAPSAMHGRSLNALFWDETWAVDLERGREIMQAATPAMVTKRDRQTWMVSTAGTAESVFLRGWVEKGRAGEVCLIEYAAPADTDLDDLAGWARWHPAFGFTQDAEGIRQARTMFEDDEAGFRRAYCNQWPEARGTVGAIPPGLWDGLRTEAPDLPDGRDAVLAVDVDLHGLSASIVAAWRVDGRAHIELVDHRDGVGWLVPRLAALRELYGIREVWAQDYGPSTAAVDMLQRERFDVQVIASKTSAAAVQAFLSAVRDGGLSHHGQSALTAAALAIDTRPYGDGLQWQRRVSGATSPITAASWAVWALARKRKRGSLRIVVAGA